MKILKFFACPLNLFASYEFAVPAGVDERIEMARL